MALLASAMPQDDACDTLIVRTQLCDLAGIDDVHIVPGRHALAHMLFEKGAALHQHLSWSWQWCHPHAEAVPTQVRTAQRDRAILGECGKEVGEEFSQD